jgi:hypothetical protein
MTNRTFKTIDPKSSRREISIFTDQGEGGRVRSLDVDYDVRYIKRYTFFFKSDAAKTPHNYSQEEIRIERNSEGFTDHKTNYSENEWNPAAARQLYKQLIKEILQPVRIIHKDGLHVMAAPDPEGEIINNDYYFYTITQEARR